MLLFLFLMSSCLSNANANTRTHKIEKKDIYEDHDDIDSRIVPSVVRWVTLWCGLRSSTSQTCETRGSWKRNFKRRRAVQTKAPRRMSTLSPSSTKSAHAPTSLIRQTNTHIPCSVSSRHDAPPHWRCVPLLLSQCCVELVEGAGGTRRLWISSTCCACCSAALAASLRRKYTRASTERKRVTV